MNLARQLSCPGEFDSSAEVLIPDNKVPIIVPDIIIPDNKVPIIVIIINKGPTILMIILIILLPDNKVAIILMRVDLLHPQRQAPVVQGVDVFHGGGDQQSRCHYVGEVVRI